MGDRTQIKKVPMKEKIKDLFKEYYNDETMPVVELEDKVLALFDDVERSEKFKCAMQLSKSGKRCDKQCIECELSYKNHSI